MSFDDERSRRKVRVDLQELRFAMKAATYERQYFVDTETGEVVLVSEMLDNDEEAQRQLEQIDEAETGGARPGPSGRRVSNGRP